MEQCEGLYGSPCISCAASASSIKTAWRLWNDTYIPSLQVPDWKAQSHTKRLFLLQEASAPSFISFQGWRCPNTCTARALPGSVENWRNEASVGGACPACKLHPYYRQSGSELILTAAGHTWAVQSQIAIFFLEPEVLAAQCIDVCVGPALNRCVQCKEIGGRGDCAYWCRDGYKVGSSKAASSAGFQMWGSKESGTIALCKRGMWRNMRGIVSYPARARNRQRGDLRLCSQVSTGRNLQ